MYSSVVLYGKTFLECIVQLSTVYLNDKSEMICPINKLDQKVKNKLSRSIFRYEFCMTSKRRACFKKKTQFSPASQLMGIEAFIYTHS